MGNAHWDDHIILPDYIQSIIGDARVHCAESNWRRQILWLEGQHPPPVEASLCPGVLPEANAMSGRYRSLRLVAPLVARAPGTWSHRAADAAGLREALCQTAEE